MLQQITVANYNRISHFEFKVRTLNLMARFFFDNLTGASDAANPSAALGIDDSVETRNNVLNGATVRFGERYKPGTYFLRIFQRKVHKEKSYPAGI